MTLGSVCQAMPRRYSPRRPLALGEDDVINRNADLWEIWAFYTFIPSSQVYSPGYAVTGL